jgi:flagellar hook-basal body complex protein FliE
LKIEKPESGTEKVPSKEAAVENIDNDFKPVINKAWEELSDNYKAQMKSVFRQTRTQRERVREVLWLMQNKFLEFLKRPDQK